MTGKKQKKNPQPKPAPKKGNGQGGGKRRGGLKGAPVHSAGSIAAGYSSSKRQEMRFNGQSNLTLGFTLAAYDVGTGAATTDGLRGTAGVANQTSSAILALTTQVGYTAAGATTVNDFVGPGCDLLSSSFTRFRPKKLKFRYCPQSGTNTTQRMMFAYANDPVHPLIMSTTPSQSKLESATDSVPFAPWEAWEMDVSRSLDKDTWLWVYDFNATATVGNAVLDRFNSLGSIGLMSSAAGTAGTGDVFGVLYVDAELEFKEFCPVSVTRPTLAPIVRAALSKPHDLPALILEYLKGHPPCSGADKALSRKSFSSSVPRKPREVHQEEHDFCERCEIRFPGRSDCPLCEECLSCPSYGGGQCTCRVPHTDNPASDGLGSDREDYMSTDRLHPTYSLSPLAKTNELAANKAIADFIAFLDTQKACPVNKDD
jgi:hypothetical protein